MNERRERQDIDIREFLAMVRRRIWFILSVTLATVGLVTFLVYHRAPLYESIAAVEVRPLSAGLELQGPSSFVNMDSEVAKVTSVSVVERAANSMGVVATSPDEIDAIIANVSVSTSSPSTFLNIACTGGSPEGAQKCAQAFADAYVADRMELARSEHEGAVSGPRRALQLSNARLASLQGQLAATSSATEGSVIESQIAQEQANQQVALSQLAQVPPISPHPALVALPASLPDGPSNKDFASLGVLAAILGLALGIGLALLRERLDESVAGSANLERALGTPVVARIPRVIGWKDRNEAKVVTLSAPESAPAEAYRAARTSLLYLSQQIGLQVVEFAGPGQREGKTTTTANLAVALAGSGREVIAVSSDLRNPRLHCFFGLENDRGLSSLLQDRARLDGIMLLQDRARLDGMLLVTSVPGLRVLPSGPVPPNPAELLGSHRMDEVMAALRKEADFVLLDTPPALTVADALELAPKSDAIMLVTDAQRSTTGQLVEMRQQFQRVGGNVVGVIVNNLDATMMKRNGRRYGGSYYATVSDEPNGWSQRALARVRRGVGSTPDVGKTDDRQT
jgi:succinoglycan biosynthesis transport protein ExoP